MTVKKDKGFTLPETLVVIAIILILSATVGFSAFKFVGKAKTTACKNQIEIFKIALQAYYLDCGAYPSGGQGLQALWEKPILAPIPANWNGPYLDREIPSDPWNNQYGHTNKINKMQSPVYGMSEQSVIRIIRDIGRKAIKMEISDMIRLAETLTGEEKTFPIRHGTLLFGKKNKHKDIVR